MYRMINWISIILLVVIGIILVITEIIFIPGTTLVGILGLLFMIAGIVTSYTLFGVEIGNYVFAITVLLGALATWYSLKSGLWKKLALKNTIDSKVNEDLIDKIKIGDIGITKSVLRPSGNVAFENGIFEVHSLMEMIQTNTQVKVIKIESNKIIVSPFN